MGTRWRGRRQNNGRNGVGSGMETAIVMMVNVKQFIQIKIHIKRGQRRRDVEVSGNIQACERMWI